MSKIVPAVLHLIKYFLKGQRNTGGLIRVDPVVTLFVIGMVLTAWNVGKGFGANWAAENMAASLRNAPGELSARITSSHKAGNMSGYDREVGLERLDLMSNVFNEFADLIEAKGSEMLDEALLQGMVDSVAALGPGEEAGRLVGGLSTGKGIDQIVGLISIKDSVEGFELISRPFSQEAEALRFRIADIFGMDANRLFLGRMQHKINLLAEKWKDLQKEYEGDPEQAEGMFKMYVHDRATIWGENPRLYGPGERWQTLAEYREWLIKEGKGEGESADLFIFPDRGTLVGACEYPYHPAPTGNLDGDEFHFAPFEFKVQLQPLLYSYDFQYTRSWQDYGDYVSIHTVHGEGSVTNGGWVSGIEQSKAVETKTIYIDGAPSTTQREYENEIEVHAIIQDDLKTLTVCPVPHYTVAEMKAIGKATFLDYYACYQCKITSISP